MENKLGTIKQWGFIALLGLSLAACNGTKQSADNNLEAKDFPSKISEAPAAKELGCDGESKKDDVNCKFVVKSSEAFMVYNGQNIKAVTQYDYNAQGQMTSMRMALPATPDKYFAIVNYTYSQIDQLKYAEEWLLDSNFDGVHDYRTSVTYEYIEGKLASTKSLTTQAANPNPIMGRSIDYKYEAQKTTTTDATFDFVTGNKQLQMSVETMDNQDRVTQREVWATNMVNAQDPIKITTTSYTYAESKAVQSAEEVVSYQDKNSQNIIIASNQNTAYKYDEQNHLVEMNSELKNVSNGGKIEYQEMREYDANGNVAVINQNWDTDGNGVNDVQAEQEYSYDGYGNATNLRISSNGAIAESSHRYVRLQEALNAEDSQVASN